MQWRTEDVVVSVQIDGNLKLYPMSRFESSNHWMSSLISLPLDTRTAITYRYGVSVESSATFNPFTWFKKDKKDSFEKVSRHLEERHHQWDANSFQHEWTDRKYRTVVCYLRYLRDHSNEETMKESMAEISHIFKKIKLGRDESIALAKLASSLITLSGKNAKRLFLLFVVGLCVKDRVIPLVGRHGVGLQLAHLYDLDRFTASDILSEASPVMKRLTKRVISEKGTSSDWIPVLKSFRVLDPDLEFADVVICTDVDQRQLRSITEFTARNWVDKLSSDQYRRLCKLLLKCASSLSCLSEILNLASLAGEGHRIWLGYRNYDEARSLFKCVLERALTCTSEIKIIWKKHLEQLAGNLPWLIPLVRDRILNVLQTAVFTSEDCQALLSLFQTLLLFTVESLCTGNESVLRKALRVKSESVQRMVFVQMVPYCLSHSAGLVVDRSVCQLCEEWLDKSRRFSNADPLSSLFDAYGKLSEEMSKPSDFRQHMESAVLKKAVSCEPRLFFKRAASGKVTSNTEHLFLRAAEKSIPQYLTVQQMRGISAPLRTSMSTKIPCYDLSFK